MKPAERMKHRPQKNYYHHFTMTNTASDNKDWSKDQVVETITKNIEQQITEELYLGKYKYFDGTLYQK